jgi:hypothetical protein
LCYACSPNTILIEKYIGILGYLGVGSAISEGERDLLVKGIIDTAFKMMGKIVSAKNTKNCARDVCRAHKQSKTEITRNTVIFNILTNVQRLPARPRDFRIKLAEQEKDIQGV